LIDKKSVSSIKLQQKGIYLIVVKHGKLNIVTKVIKN